MIVKLICNEFWLFWSFLCLIKRFFIPIGKQNASNNLRGQKTQLIYSSRLNEIPFWREYKEEELTTAEIKEEISFHITMRQNLQVTLPNFITIGAFVVNVYPLKEFLINKRSECAKSLLIMFTEKIRAEIDDILDEYRQIRYKLKEVPQSIEHIFEIRDWMETIPLRVQDLEEKMDKLKIDYDILDSFLWNISDDDFEAKWEVIGSPFQIEKEVKYSL